MIKVTYQAVDGYRHQGSYRTLAGARRFAQKWVGADAAVFPGSTYAFSVDGVGLVTCEGCPVYALFALDANAAVDAILGPGASQEVRWPETNPLADGSDAYEARRAELLATLAVRS